MKRSSYGWLGLFAVGIAIAIGITLFSPFASDNPDGLESVAKDNGFVEEAKGSSYEIIPGYSMPGVDNERLSTILAGVAGVLIVAGVGLALGYGPRLRQRRNVESDDGSGSLSSSKAGPGVQR
jgi:cobalt/nickel transport system permease protein